MPETDTWVYGTVIWEILKQVYPANGVEKKRILQLTNNLVKPHLNCNTSSRNLDRDNSFPRLDFG